MTKQELVAEVGKRLALPHRKALAVVNTLFGKGGILCAELRKGGRVLISGFGHFETRARAARNGRDPRTGRRIAIEASTGLVFRPGKPLREMLNRRK